MHGFMVKVMGAGLVPVATRTFKYENLARAEFERECKDDRYTVVLFDTDENGFWRSINEREGAYSVMCKRLHERFRDLENLACDLSCDDWDNIYNVWVRVSDYIGRTIYEGYCVFDMARALVDHMREHPQEHGYRYNGELRKKKVE